MKFYSTLFIQLFLNCFPKALLFLAIICYSCCAATRMVYVSGSAQCIFLCSHWSGDVLFLRAGIPIQSFTLQSLSLRVFLRCMQPALLLLMVKGYWLSPHQVGGHLGHLSSSDISLCSVLLWTRERGPYYQWFILIHWKCWPPCHPMSSQHCNACQSNLDVFGFFFFLERYQLLLRMVELLTTAAVSLNLLELRRF